MLKPFLDSETISLGNLLFQTSVFVKRHLLEKNITKSDYHWKKDQSFITEISRLCPFLFRNIEYIEAMIGRYLLLRSETLENK